MATLTQKQRQRNIQINEFIEGCSITPDSIATDILHYFQAYLENIATKKKGGKVQPLSSSSVATYGSCARSYFQKYANGKIYKLKYVLHETFIEKSMKCDRQHGCIKRSSQMIRCGLKHLKKFYEQICKHKGYKQEQLYEQKDIPVSFKPVTIRFKHVSKISHATKEENIQEYIESNPPPNKKRKIVFDDQEDLQEYLANFVDFQANKKQKQIFQQHGFKQATCANSAFYSD